MCQMILLQVADVRGELSVMQPVMRAVVADVSEDAAREDRDGGIPVVPEDSMGQLVEGGGQDQEQTGWHHQTVPVHRKVMVNAVQEKV